jgi:hypothetical protein
MVPPLFFALLLITFGDARHVQTMLRVSALIGVPASFMTSPPN